ncbi:MAG: 50S ribosomal protein L27 [bacterium]|nr:50S ribosomal protein L27 [bacterium]
MAHTKSGGSTKLGRDSRSKRLGVKINHDQAVKVGEIIIRQRGSKYLAGKNVLKAGDDTLFAKINGKVKFATTKKIRFDRKQRYATSVSVVTESK